MKKILPVLAFVLVLIFLYAPFCLSGEEKVSISGKFVRNSASGLPLNDIQIKVTGTKELVIRTDRSGNYIAYNLPAGGNYTVTPFKAGFLFSPESKTYTNLTASKINENFGVTERTYSISGKVIVGGKPSKGEVIMINTRAVKYFTNEDGEYFIDNLPYEGPYIVTVESNKVVFEPFKIDQLDKDIVYNFEKSIKAMGYVTSSGKGIAGVEIAVNNKRYKTDENGYYEINGLAANGSYILAVINSEMNPVPKFVELKKVTQDIDNVNFSLSGSIAGSVQMNNKPFAGALIKAASSSGQTEETKTDKNGAYKINQLGIYGDYTISVSSPGYMFSPKDRTVKKLANQTEGQNFTASIQKYRIYGVVMKGKTFVKDAEISIDGISKVIKTDAQGAYSFDGLTAGKDYSVSVKSKQIKFLESKKTVNGISGDTEINFNGLLSISGKVTIDEMPLENAKVLYDFNSFVLTDKNGNYTIDGLMPNQVYTLEVSSNNYKFTPSIFTSERLQECLTDENFKVVIDYKMKEKEEKLAREEAAKKAKEEERLRKEELKRIEAEERKAREEAKKKALEEEKARKEELAKAALREKAARDEAAKQSQEEKKKQTVPVKEEVKSTVINEDEIQIALLQEKLAREEAAKKAKEEEKLRKEELKRIEAEERKAREEAKKKALEEEKAKKEELAKAALQEKLAREEAVKKAKEEEKLRKEELKRIEAEERKAREEAKKKALEEEKAKKEEIAKAALQEKLAREEAAKKAKEEERLRKEELKRIEAEEKKAREEKKKQTIPVKEEVKAPAINEDEIQIALLQEKLAREEAVKKAKEEERLRKEELKRIEAEERKAREEAKKKSLEEEKAKKEEIAKAALQEKLAREEAAKKAKEEERLRKEELKRIEAEERKAREEAKKKASEEEKFKKDELKKTELQEKINQEQKRRLEMQAQIALQEQLAQEEEAKKQELQNKLIQEQENKKKQEEERLKKEEEIRIAEQQAEQERLRREEQKKAELRDKLAKEQEKKQKQEEERLKKEEEKRIKEQQKEQEKLEKEAEKKRIAEEKLAAKEAAKKAKEEERLRKEELKRIEREAKEAEKIKESDKKESQPMTAAVALPADKNTKLSIAGRVLKGRYGVARIQIKLLADGKTDTFFTDKYGYYLIPDLERDKDYVVTVVSDNNVLNISPKSRVYKKINGNFTNHNYYVVTEK